ncbi:hemogen [Malurus melanocephalus]|uniref:hemogen n=1 Tax=Malurus melanocephalus TaxID=175006 RepID=UPI002549B9BB|nr:hemogen [Malurus melanocephalus]
MENLGKDDDSPDSSLTSTAAREAYAVPDVIITRRLRDREMLRKRKAEALEKDAAQWIVRDYKSKQQRRGRKGKRGRRRQTVVKAVLESEPELEPQLIPEEMAEPESSELVLPEPIYPEQPPVLTIQNVVSGMQAPAREVELAAGSLDPADSKKGVAAHDKSYRKLNKGEIKPS